MPRTLSANEEKRPGFSASNSVGKSCIVKGSWRREDVWAMSIYRSAVLTVFFSASTALLTSCSGTVSKAVSNPILPTPKGTGADLRGGWLIAGTMPLSTPLDGGTFPFGLALNLDIINGQVTGYGSLQFPCSSNGSILGGVGGGTRLASAAIAADGTFTLTDVLVGTNMQHQIVVQGTVPAMVGGSWSGTYIAAAPQASCNGVEPPSQTGTFIAERIADLNGTFAGHGLLNNTSAVVSFAAAMTQGGPTSLNSLTSALNDQSVLNGTLQVQGISCFQGGTIKTTRGFPEASLIGNQAQMEFLMDDGSTVWMNGAESDMTASTLTNVTLLVVGGGCDKAFTSLTTATKQ